MQRILLLVVAFAIAAVPGFAAGAVIVAPATTTTASVGTTTTKTTTTTATTSTVSTASVATTGNGAPSGSHYNLNIIGVPKDKTADMNNNDGHRIFVQLNGGEAAGALPKLFKDLVRLNTILLVPAPTNESFRVLDANATDINGAKFQLPVDVSAKWTVWARAVGTPGGHADMTTCAASAGLDGILGTADDEVICSLTTLSIDRKNGRPAPFTDVSTDLLFITVAAGTPAAVCAGTTMVPLFSGCLVNEFWNYDNNGLKVLQLRFYPMTSAPLL